MRPQPILVVGMNRSGTTWLTNLLCNHPQIAGVQVPEHFGIIESNMFGHFQEMFGDLSFEENFEGLLALWSHTDFYRVAKGDIDRLRASHQTPRSYMGLFQELMDGFADSFRCPYWVQKVSPLRVHHATSLLERARLVVIQRDCAATVVSAARLLENEGRRQNLVKIAIGYGFQEKLLNALRRRHSVIEVNYDQLHAKTPETMRSVCDQLGIDFDSNLVTSKYRQNSSFASPQKRTRIGQRDRQMIRLGHCLARGMPIGLSRKLRRKWGLKARRLVSGSFRLAKSATTHV